MFLSSLNVQLLLAVVLIIEATTTDLKDGDPCVTPNQENSTCIPFRQCNVLLAAAFDHTPETTNFFEMSKCCSVEQLVCCGSSASLNNPPSPAKAEKIYDEYHIESYLSDSTVCGLDALLGEKIQGGTVAKLKEFPWLAALEYKSALHNTNAGIRCGGSVISRSHILTAAHCIMHVEFVIIKVWLGATNISSNENCLNLTGNSVCANSIQKFNVRKAHSHKLYDSSRGYHDIGLLQLADEVTFTDYIRPICLLTSLPSPKPGTYMTVAGWGATENSTGSDVKLKVDVPVQDDSICNKFLSQERKIISLQLCAGGETGKDSCKGDSGGPLMNSFQNADQKIQWYQEGIVSYGVGCGITQRPAIYTRVPAYADWIWHAIYYFEHDLDKGELCTTPKKTSGRCVPLYTCQEVFNASSAKNKSLRYFATESYCGIGIDEILVCCESPGSVIEYNFKSKALPDETVCGAVKNNSRLLGSETVDVGEFPWVAYIQFIDSAFTFAYTGSLINNRYVLTADQGLFDFTPSEVLLGDWNNMSTVLKIPIKQVIAFPFGVFGVWYDQDIGLLLLENKVEFTDYIRPICLPLPNMPSPEIGTRMTAIGWSETENGRRLRKTTTLSISNGECQEKYFDDDVVIRLQYLCTTTNPAVKQVSFHDLGAPLIRTYENKSSGKMQWYLEGLVVLTFGFPKDSSYPAVYNRVSTYMPWIVNVISEN